uniref:LisH domain-containing protein n=1 Tax=Panagrolaimus sp. ES5 TaxID=591445 RepID=A0AC34GQ77_9BILA
MSHVLVTAKQHIEINTALAGYLKKNGYLDSFKAFLAEADLQNENIDASAATLERKFLTNARLQVKVTNLEKQLAELQAEACREVPARTNRKPEEWLPRSPERGTLIGHRMSINRVIFHPIYTLIVSGSDDASIRIWDVLTGRCERALTGHTNAVNDLAFNAKGNQLLSCSSDMTAKLWDFGQTYSCLRSFAGHDHSITTVAFTADNMFLTGSRDSLIKLWEPETARCIHNFRGHEDWVVKVWSMENKALVVDLYGHDHVVECVAWASEATVKAMKIPDDKEADVLIEGSPLVLASAGRDKSIRVWHVNIGACLFTIDGHDNWVRGLVFHPLGNYLISVADDKTMRTWDMDNQKQIKSILPHNQFVSGVDFHKTEPYVVTCSADSTLKLWECR